MPVTIRNEESKDIDQVRDILRAAFLSDAESRLVDLLRANGKATISLVAVDGNEVLGHVLFSPVSTTPPINAKGIGLAPVAVRTDVQAHGIGSRRAAFMQRIGLRLLCGAEFTAVLSALWL